MVTGMLMTSPGHVAVTCPAVMVTGFGASTVSVTMESQPLVAAPTQILV